MFYEPAKKNHGLPRDPFKSLIIPRPIGWITTISPEGVINLAPYSHFNICSSDPPAVMFAPSSRIGSDLPKDSQRNAEATGEFVVNVATYDLREKMNVTSGEYDQSVSEVALAGLSTLPSRIVSVPRLKESPVNLECRHVTTVTLPNSNRSRERASVVIGEVVGIHIDESVLTDGFVDIEKLRPIARLGYLDYAVVDKKFTMPRPKNPSNQKP